MELQSTEGQSHCWRRVTVQEGAGKKYFNLLIKPIGNQRTKKPRCYSSKKVSVLGLKLSKKGLRWGFREEVKGE